MSGSRGYFPPAIDYAAARDYIKSGMCKDYNEYKQYAHNHPSWEMDVVFAFVEKAIGFPCKYPKMKDYGV